MKTQWNITRSGGLRMELTVLAVIFWIAQILACNFVTTSLLFPASQTLGAIALGGFVFLFCLRLDLRSSRLPAVLGAASVTAATAFVWLVVHTSYRYEQVAFLLAASLALALAGILVDGRRWLRRGVKRFSRRLERLAESHRPAWGGKRS